MKRKEYKEPVMQVVKLQHQSHLLQASLRNYQFNEYQEE